jgi:UDP-N-acetylmuramoyl-L-alanyl-D-glutamate--2,6-diaminopimelate ligase
MTSWLSRLRETAFVRALRAKLPNRLVNFLYHLPLAAAAAVYYRFPGKRLVVIGVTGTDGKTTTANLIYHLLRENGARVSMVTTINAAVGGREYDTGFHVTSPHPFTVQRLLREAVEAGSEYFVLEVTSHGLDQQRGWGIPFALAVYTNLAGDHLAYHGSRAAYLAAKAKLARVAEKVVLNADDPYSDDLVAMADLPAAGLVWYGLKKKADFQAGKIEFGAAATRFQLVRGKQKLAVKTPLLGRFNVENVLAAVAAVSTVAARVALEEIVRAVESFPPLPGRMELIDRGQPFTVMVDFAHTPNALEKVLAFLDRRRPPGGRIIVVFGCAGERDPGRRRMGEVAARLADLSVITAEDPRLEGVEKISEEVAAWARKGGAEEVPPDEFQKGGDKRPSGRALFTRVPDRERAIKLAFGCAGAGDVVLITGKGHEKSMCFGRTETPWSDQEAAARALTEMGFDGLE